VSTVTVGEFDRQLGLRGETGGKSKTSGTGEMALGDEKPSGILVQYVEGLNGETVRRSRVSALAAEAS